MRRMLSLVCAAHSLTLVEEQITSVCNRMLWKMSRSKSDEVNDPLRISHSDKPFIYTGLIML
jgi:hypothetical protein